MDGVQAVDALVPQGRLELFKRIVDESCPGASRDHLSDELGLVIGLATGKKHPSCSGVVTEGCSSLRQGRKHDAEIDEAVNQHLVMPDVVFSTAASRSQRQ